MKKTIIIASIAVLASAAVLTTFALSGAGKFGNVRANADGPADEYSVTFDASDESKTTIETFGDNLAICTTTAAGNKVGVVGFDKTAEFGLSFRGYKCHHLFIFDFGTLEDAKAYDFGHITGFTVVFDGDELSLEWEDDNGEDFYNGQLKNGVRFNVTCTPYNHPIIQGEATISSLTIWYSC